LGLVTGFFETGFDAREGFSGDVFLITDVVGFSDACSAFLDVSFCTVTSFLLLEVSADSRLGNGFCWKGENLETHKSYYCTVILKIFQLL